MRTIARSATTTIVIALALACHRSATAPSPTPAGTVIPVSLAITGPSRIAPGEAVAFRATATMSDRTTQDYTQKATWRADPITVLAVAPGGQATGVAPGDAFLTASLPPPYDRAPQASVYASVSVLPPNTYRLTGKVLESGLGVSGATVAVLSGVGAGSSATTGYDGQYHLYGVAGTVQIKVTKAGYVDIVKTFDVFQNEVLDFPEARQSAGMPTITGPYIVSLQLDPGCPTVATDPRILPVPAELRQPRLYAAQVTQDGPSLTVTLTDPTFAPRSNKFSGRIEPDAIDFSLGDGYVGYGPDDAITEHISSSLELSWEGVVRAARSGSAIVGRLDGWVQVFDPSRPFVAQLIGECNAPNNLFSMKPTSGTLR